MNLGALKTAVTSKMGRQVLKIQKHSPVILFVTGAVGFGATVVLAASATLKLEGILDEHHDYVEKIETAKTDMPDVYSEDDAKKDSVKLHVQTGVKIAKLYTPAFLIGVASLAAFTGAHVVLNRRYAGVVAAYAVLDTTFKGYQERVKEKYGEAAHLELKHDMVDHNVVDADGKITGVVKSPRSKSDVSEYARYFDASSTQWQRFPSYNAVFLRAQQNWANDLLKSRGHVWLNEVYQMLGFEHTKAGAQVGWVLDDGQNDGYIDFGVFSGHNDGVSMAFVDGSEGSIKLDFNVDGVILDKI